MPKCTPETMPVLSRFETKLHGFGGDCKGGFWDDFGQDFGVNFEKGIAYLFRHPRVRAHV